MRLFRLALLFPAFLALAACVEEFAADTPSPVPYIARLDGGHMADRDPAGEVPGPLAAGSRAL